MRSSAAAAWGMVALLAFAVDHQSVARLCCIQHRHYIVGFAAVVLLHTLHRLLLARPPAQKLDAQLCGGRQRAKGTWSAALQSKPCRKCGAAAAGPMLCGMGRVYFNVPACSKII